MAYRHYTFATRDQVERWLGLTETRPTDERRIDSEQLDRIIYAANEWVSSQVSIQEPPPGYDVFEPALTQAVVMLCSRWFTRRNSIYGIDAVSLGGEAGGVLTNDPDIQRLIDPHRRARIASYPLSLAQVR